MPNYVIINNLLNFHRNFFILTRHTKRITPNIIHLRAPLGMNTSLLFGYTFYCCIMNIIFFPII